MKEMKLNFFEENDMKKDKERIEKLRADLLKYNQYYYTNNESLISDVEYDMLMNELKELEEKYPEYKSEASPTVIVGASNLRENKFQKVTHKKTYAKSF